ncbi:MAG TPA: tripartite tricarboxylate transporter substrate binding protein [Hyphomicrobiaceae bacterium]|nr:tripartite tricarboxylate transporter substrate binding protein [Hyphomicrobiaceae bacterium]
MYRLSRRTFLAGAAAGACLTSRPATAADYPTQAVKIVVPFSAGSMTDLLARVIAEKLQQGWNREVVVENRPGLAGTSSAAKAAADGYTLMLTSNGHTVIGHLNKNLSFDPAKDFVGVTQVAVTPLIMAVPPDSPAKTVKDLIEMARAKPGALNYSSAGLGSTTGIAGALFKQTTNTDIVHVAFKGLPETHTAIIRGDVAMGFSFFAAAGDLILSGKVRALAVTGPNRLSVLPEVPTFKEAGVPEFEYDAWFGILALAGTPTPIITKVSQDVADVLRQPDVKARFEPQGAMLVSNAPSQFDQILRNDTLRYAGLFKEAN